MSDIHNDVISQGIQGPHVAELSCWINVIYQEDSCRQTELPVTSRYTRKW